MGKAAKVFCEECMEDIPAKEVYWEGNRAYCGQCGGELDLKGEGPDLVDTLVGGRAPAAFSHDEDEGLDDLDDDELDDEFLGDDDEAEDEEDEA